ncbi:MAG TPA: hypothetical protein PKA63_09850 [Oligoflexia bacterium]|nr:hypothetical protein [Oligoflexia bacterium]HMP48958.1 hypothetical protein [Oligoflexia bacterium]
MKNATFIRIPKPEELLSDINFRYLERKKSRDVLISEQSVGGGHVPLSRKSSVCFVSGCSAQLFDPDKHSRTKSKTFSGSSDEYFLNASLPVAIKLANNKRRVVVQASPKDFDTVKKLLEELPCREFIRVFDADLSDPEWISDLDEILFRWDMEEKISCLDAILYESYTADVDEPFRPIWEEDPSNIASAIERRIIFFQTICNYLHALSVDKKQQEIRLIAITALASYRPVAYLFADAAHKTVSSTFLKTWAIEAGEHINVPVSVVEICPGVLDTGLYDRPAVRARAWQKARMTGKPFDLSIDPNKIETWPMLSPDELAEICTHYLLHERKSDTEKASHKEIEKKHSRILPGGSIDENDSPLYNWPDYPWGKLPPLPLAGYTPVFLAPFGQKV